MNKLMPLSAPFNSITTSVMSSIDKGAPYPPMTSVCPPGPSKASSSKSYPPIPSPSRSEDMLVEEEQDSKDKPLDANRYATKKTIAQGMLDIALLTANASQLKYVLTIGAQHQFYTLMVALITISIILQVLTAIISLVLGSAYNINKAGDQKSANTWNNVALACNIITVAVNVVISGFDMRDTNNITPMKSNATFNDTLLGKLFG